LLYPAISDSMALPYIRILALYIYWAHFAFCHYINSIVVIVVIVAETAAVVSVDIT